MNEMLEGWLSTQWVAWEHEWTDTARVSSPTHSFAQEYLEGYAEAQGLGHPGREPSGAPRIVGWVGSRLFLATPAACWTPTFFTCALEWLPSCCLTDQGG